MIMIENKKMYFPEIDLCRGLGIILVVLGHALKQTGETNTVFQVLLSVIYSFHMPLFFVLSGFVSVKKDSTRWYPAYQVRGEGIFIELNQDDIEHWVQDNPRIRERAERLNFNYCESFIGKNHPRTISPKFIMLHTLAHLLITQLSFECGYSVASLSERLYCAEESDGKKIAGILIYTASGDSEGTLGGLVRQGCPDAFPIIFRKAVYTAKTCSNDPVCIMSKGQGRDSLNLAACHACALLPETCCEERNSFLDRGMIAGTFEERNIGFFSEI